MAILVASFGDSARARAADAALRAECFAEVWVGAFFAERGGLAETLQQRDVAPDEARRIATLLRWDATMLTVDAGTQRDRAIAIIEEQSGIVFDAQRAAELRLARLSDVPVLSNETS